MHSAICPGEFDQLLQHHFRLPPLLPLGFGAGTIASRSPDFIKIKPA